MASRYMNDEVGEWWNELCEMWPSIQRNASETLVDAFIAEIEDNHQLFKEEYKYIEVKEMREIVLRDLIHISELDESED